MTSLPKALVCCTALLMATACSTSKHLSEENGQPPATDSPYQLSQALPPVESENVVLKEARKVAKPKVSPQALQKSSTMVMGGHPASATLNDSVVSYPVYVGQDKFGTIETNPVKLVAEEPVSTFSVDVDTASYGFVRRMLKSGVLPQKNSVRIEEMINYFDYAYAPAPDRTTPFKPNVAVYPTPWNPKSRILHVGIRGHELMDQEKPPANLVFLLDVSGSMAGPDRLGLVKRSMAMLVENLQANDTVGVVVYAGAAGVVLEPTAMNQKGKILAAMERLEAGGSTAGGEGIRLAYALARQYLKPEGVNRVILATDGDFNVGIANQEELQSFIEKQRQSGVSLSVLGFGQGNYNDAMMQALAQNGNGNASYIDSLSEARKVLVEEAGATLFTIAKDVKIQVEFNPARVAEYRLIGYENRLLDRADFNNDKVDAGEVGAGHRVTALYEVVLTESSGRLIDDSRYSPATSQPVPGTDVADEICFLKLRYKLPKLSNSELLTLPVTDKHMVQEIGKVSDDIRFAAAVAGFGQLLRNDPYTHDFTYDQVLQLARTARGSDDYGYRSEFLQLVGLAKSAQAL